MQPVGIEPTFRAFQARIHPSISKLQYRRTLQNSPIQDNFQLIPVSSQPVRPAPPVKGIRTLSRNSQRSILSNLHYHVFFKMVPCERFELPTNRFVAGYSKSTELTGHYSKQFRGDRWRSQPHIPPSQGGSLHYDTATPQLSMQISTASDILLASIFLFLSFHLQ